MNNQIQALNYCAHAIEHLKLDVKAMRTKIPASAQVILNLIEMLQSSIKFILPNGCNLIDPQDLRQSHLDLLKLPYPLIALEAPWELEIDDQIEEIPTSPATKRIALCWDAEQNILEPIPGLNKSVLNKFPQGGVFVVPIYWSPDFKHWSTAMGGSFIPYNNEMGDLSSEQNLNQASKIAVEALAQSGRTSSRPKAFRAEPFALLPEIFEKCVTSLGKEQAYSQIILDAHDEASMLIQTCAVLNCSNITTADIEAPKFLNKKRSEKGKQPFFSYKVLQLCEEKSQQASGMGGGSHASPRMHLRRGHLRRLENKTIWVKPAMVNANVTHGIVVKDYAVS
jgi:hypothetical protein